MRKPNYGLSVLSGKPQLMSASLIVSQVAKTVFTYAPLTGWILGAIFYILAIIAAIKAYSQR